MKAMKMNDSLNLQQVQIAVHLSKPFGISEKLIQYVLSGDLETIEQLSEKLLELVNPREEVQDKAQQADTFEPHGKKPIGKALVGYLIAEMIKRCADMKHAPPIALANLVAVYLHSDLFGQTHLRAPGELNRAALVKLAYPDVSIGEIARRSGASRAEVSKWNADGTLDHAKAALAKMLPLPPQVEVARAYGVDGLDAQSFAAAALAIILKCEW